MKEERQKGFENVSRLRTRVQRHGSKGGISKRSGSSPESDLSEPKESYLKWLEGRQLAAQTIDHRRGYLDLFFNWSDERGISKAQDVTLAVLESYQHWLTRYRKKDGKPLSSRTIRGRLSGLQDYFRWLVRHGLLGANPASELILPKKESRLPEQALTLSQIEILMSVPDIEDLLGLRDRAMLEVLYGTAMRLGELNKLELGDIQYSKNILQVRQGKGKKDRMLPIGARAMHWLTRYLDEARPSLEIKSDVLTVFLTGYGEGFHPSALGTHIRKYFRKAEIMKGGAHLLRHTCATHLLDGGADIRYIQKLLGHASLETTAIYTEMNVESLRQVFEDCHPTEKRWKQKQC